MNPKNLGRYLKVASSNKLNVAIVVEDGTCVHVGETASVAFSVDDSILIIQNGDVFDLVPVENIMRVCLTPLDATSEVKTHIQELL